MVQIVEEFKIRFEKALSYRNMRPIDISHRTGIAESTISQYRSGYSKPKNDRLALIANVLDINPAWLMGCDVPMERPVGIAIQEPSSLSPQETELVRVFRSFNNEGREKVMDYVRLLERDGSYIKNNENAVVG